MTIGRDVDSQQDKTIPDAPLRSLIATASLQMYILLITGMRGVTATSLSNSALRRQTLRARAGLLPEIHQQYMNLLMSRRCVKNVQLAMSLNLRSLPQGGCVLIASATCFGT